MAKAEIKILEAEKLHQPIIPAVRMIPIIPLERQKGENSCEPWVNPPVGATPGLTQQLVHFLGRISTFGIK